MEHGHRVCVVIPAYRVADRVLDVIRRIGPEVERIYVVDDRCPEGTADRVTRSVTDGRVKVIRHDRNLGVGGAVMTGYRAALEEGMTIAVKVDGDGQMDPSLIPTFIRPIQNGWADYTKGNRFFELSGVRSMPVARLLGNAALSFMSKTSTGYWHVFDPTNGYTAIDMRVVERLPLHKISARYFFETDMLFRLNTLRCVVMDLPMSAVYAGEASSLRPTRIVFEFAYKNLRNLATRIFYNYFLRDLSIATAELVIGLGLVLFGTVFGAMSWMSAASRAAAAPLGTIMLAVLPILIGVQLLLAFLSFDMSSVPMRPIGPLLAPRRSIGLPSGAQSQQE